MKYLLIILSITIGSAFYKPNTIAVDNLDKCKHQMFWMEFFNKPQTIKPYLSPFLKIQSYSEISPVIVSGTHAEIMFTNYFKKHKLSGIKRIEYSKINTNNYNFHLVVMSQQGETMNFNFDINLKPNQPQITSIQLD